jgi:hypothetical protein
MELFEYNSEREDLVISEYGRHIQKLIQYASKIENEDERQLVANAIIELMHQMNPQSKNIDEYKDTLWKHLFRIADYDINVKSDSGDVPQRPDSNKRHPVIGYPQSEFAFPQYGKYVQAMIEKALTLEDPDKKKEFMVIIGSYMKMAYKNWNREHFISDDVIKADLKAITGDSYEIPEDFQLETLSKEKKRRKYSSSSNGRGRSGRRRRK